MSGVVRSIKNVAKGFTEVQRKVREATSNDAWGPSGTLMNEIAQYTYNQQSFIEAMDMIDKRLNDKGKNWRHVFKALLLLDYCLHVGSDDVVKYAKENIYVVKTLKEFQQIDDSGNDVGANVRQKARDITNLLMDDSRLAEERRRMQQMRERMAGVHDYMNDSIGRGNPDGYLGSPQRSQTKNWNSGSNNYALNREERELKMALEESRRMAEQESRKRVDSGDDDLAKAIRLSEQEAREAERKAKEKLEKENQEKLFGSESVSAFSGVSQSSVFDASANPYLQQQQQQLQQQQQQLQQQQLQLQQLQQQQTAAQFLQPQHTQLMPLQQNKEPSLLQLQQMQEQQRQQQLQQMQQVQQLQQLQQLQPQLMQPTGLSTMTFSNPISASPQLAFQNTTGMTSSSFQQQQQFLQPGNNNFQSQFGGFGQTLQAQMTGLPQQPQMTGLAPFQQPTATGFFQQPQATGMSNNPFNPKPQDTMSTGSFGSSLSAMPTNNWTR